MAQASAVIDIPAPPDQVWQLVGGFNSLEMCDNAARSYSYPILQAPFPITGYFSTLRVQETDGGKGSRVEWSGKLHRMV